MKPSHDPFNADDYRHTFDTRGDLYNQAAAINAEARQTERQLLLDLLKIEHGHVICDVPAGGGYLADGLRALVDDARQIICVEPSVRFAEAIAHDFVQHISDLDVLPLADASVDRVGSLAGVHHLADKEAFFREAYRILKPGGLFALADALEDTDTARFLNGPVDRYTETGHRGQFLRANECEALLVAAGFTDVHVALRQYSWKFLSLNEMLRYVRTLFGMVKASNDDVQRALQQHFRLVEDELVVELPWSLVYGVGRKKQSLIEPLRSE